MKRFRDPQIQKEGICFGLITAAACCLSGWMGGGRFVLLTFGACFAMAVIWIMGLVRRQKQMDELALDIDRVLHGRDELDFQCYTEGELAILQSEIHKMVVRLREQKNQLREDKIRLADSIADISHQVRTPLTALQLLSVRLEQPTLLPEERQRLCRELTRLLEKIDRLITALLKISRLDAGAVEFEQQQILLKTLLQKAEEPLLIPLELRDIRLEIKAEGCFCGDLLWSSEAVANILKNCMEHTPAGGVIWVNADENPLYSEIVIRDSGPGIAEKDLPHLFERFYKGENSSENSFGIGLALARMIVTSQQGTLKAENHPDGGAVFTMRFYKGTV